MISIIQRVSEAAVRVDGQIVGQIGAGLVVLAAIVREDSAQDIAWTAGKLVSLRIFRNGEKHFDRDLREIGGSILLISNFTVAAATRKGRRPSLDAAASPPTAQLMFDQLVQAVKAHGVPVATGVFGAGMQVSLTNDGPATFILNSREESTQASDRP